MIPLKAKLTALILGVINKAPFLAGQGLRYHARRFQSKDSVEPESLRWDDIVSEASLMDDKTTWRGVHAVMPLSKDEAAKIHKYMYKNSLSFGPGKKMLNINFFGSGYQSLGIIDFSNNLIFSSMRVSLVTELPRSCSVNILYLPNGIIYLSLYVHLSSAATRRLSKVSVSHITRYVSLFSFNPFSKKSSFIVHHDRHNQIEDCIYGIAKNVVSQVNEAVAALLNMWGIRKGAAEISRLADFSRDSANPYFRDATDEISQHRIIIDPSSKFLTAKIGGAIGEEFINRQIPDQLGVDGIFIHSEDRSKIEESDQYMNSDQSGLNKHAPFLYLKSIEKKMLVCSELVGALFGADSRGTNSILYRFDAFSSRRNAASLKALISQDLSLNIIEERIDSLKKSIHWFDSAYINYLTSNLAYMSELAVELRRKIKTRHDITNAELQLSNLGWMKKYSRRMWYLVWMQVILAVIAVDWSSKGIDNNSMFRNYHALKESFFK